MKVERGKSLKKHNVRKEAKTDRMGLAWMMVRVDSNMM